MMKYNCRHCPAQHIIISMWKRTHYTVNIPPKVKTETHYTITTPMKIATETYSTITMEKETYTIK